MSELMTFQEAYEKANDGDSITDEYDNFIIKGGTDASFSASSIMKNNWKIIPAEPEVLTASEWALMEYGENGKHDYFIDDIEESFEAGDKNGQLRYKELRDKVQLYVDDPDVQFHESGIAEALEKLNP